MPIYLHYHNAYGHPTCQSTEMPQGAPAQDEAILRGHVTN